MIRLKIPLENSRLSFMSLTDNERMFFLKNYYYESVSIPNLSPETFFNTEIPREIIKYSIFPIKKDVFKFKEAKNYTREELFIKIKELYQEENSILFNF